VGISDYGDVPKGFRYVEQPNTRICQLHNGDCGRKPVCPSVSCSDTNNNFLLSRPLVLNLLLVKPDFIHVTFHPLHISEEYQIIIEEKVK
jgi:hypothetical protein